MSRKVKLSAPLRNSAPIETRSWCTRVARRTSTGQRTAENESAITMADDPTKRDYRDRDRINVNEPYEVRYWSDKWSVSPDRLKDAVREVGPMVNDVKRKVGK